MILSVWSMLVFTETGFIPGLVLPGTVTSALTFIVVFFETNGTELAFFFIGFRMLFIDWVTFLMNYSLLPTRPVFYF